MIDYLVNIQTTVDALATTRSPIPNNDVVDYTLDVLNYNYTRIQSMLQTQIKLDLLFDELVPILICEEDLIQRHQPTEIPIVLYTHQTPVVQSTDSPHVCGSQNDKHFQGCSHRFKNFNKNKDDESSTKECQAEEEKNTKQNPTQAPPILAPPLCSSLHQQVSSLVNYV